MPYRTPDTVPNERTGIDGKPFKDNSEAMSQKDVELQDEAEAYGERHHQSESDQERKRRRATEAEEQLESARSKRPDAG